MAPTTKLGRPTAEGPAREKPRTGEAARAWPLVSKVQRRERRRWFIVGLCDLLLAGGVALGVLSGSAPSLASPLASSSKLDLSKRIIGSSPIQPTSLALVGSDLYIADPGRQEILMRSPNGVFTVVAGTGVAGFSGDGGSATRARIDDPSDLVALRSGSLLFEQARPGHGGVVREITPGGVIRTLAGLHPSCAGVAPGATSIAANSAPVGGTLSVSANGLPLLFPAQPCPHATRLGPFLQLTPRGELTDTKLDTSHLTHSTLLVSCGPSASGSGFTAFFCFSGAGHPKRLLVLRGNGTTEAYPAFSGGALASAGGEVVAARDDAVVRVMSHGLQTVASTAALDRLVRESNILSVIGLALSRTGNIFLTTDQISHKGCTATISELSSSGARLQVLWSRFSRDCY